MTQEEQDLADYQQTRRQVEEKLDELNGFWRKEEQVTNETYSEIQRMVQRFGATNEPMDFARQELVQLEESFFSELDREKRKLLLREEEAEEVYRKKTCEQNNQ